MKVKILILLTILCGLYSSIKSQGTWTQLTNFGGGNRELLAWFQINNYGYAGLGRNNTAPSSDLWQFDPINDTWSQKASKPGGGVFAPGFFVIGDTAYIVSGWSNSGSYHTVWAYIASTNSWIQKNNFPGPARYAVISFAINGKGYMGMGYAPFTNDFWKYTPQTDSWLQVASFPGSPRVHPTGVAVDGKGYAGLGYDGSSFDDWWEYDPSTNSWTAKAQFPGGARRGTSNFEMNGKVYVAAGYNDISYYNDLWEYNTANNSWTQLLPNMSVPGRYAAFGFGFNGCAYIGSGSRGGVASPIELQDVWKYCLNTGTDELSSQQLKITITNPSSGDLEINFPDNFSNTVKLEIYSTDGKKLFSNDIIPHESKAIIHLNNFANGIYFYSLLQKGMKVKSGKFILENN